MDNHELDDFQLIFVAAVRTSVTSELNQLARNAGSVLGFSLDILALVVERMMLDTKVNSPLHNLLIDQQSTFCSTATKTATQFPWAQQWLFSVSGETAPPTAYLCLLLLHFHSHITSLGLVSELCLLFLRLLRAYLQKPVVRKRVRWSSVGLKMKHDSSVV